MNPLSKTIEHTLLGATTTPAQVTRLCAEAVQCRFWAVCVPPIYVARAKSELRLSAVRVVSVVGFPLGGSLPAAQADEAERVLALGADEIDMVIPLGLALAGELGEVTRAVEVVRNATRGKVLKAILETGLFGPSELESVARAALAGAPDFLKTSTGFGPRGASVEDVECLVRCSSGQAQVKASGGIRTASQARALLQAGATRLGTSAGVAIVSDPTERERP